MVWYTLKILIPTSKWRNQWASLHENHSSLINKSEQSHDYRHFYSALKRSVNFYLNKLESFLLKDAWCNIWSSGSGEDLLTLFSFSYFAIKSSWNSTCPFIWISFTQGCCLPNLVEIGQTVLMKKLGKYFRYLPLEKGMNQISTKLNPFYWRMPFAKFCWN